MDVYKVSRVLSNVKLFCEFELHEQTNLGQPEKGVTLAAKNSKSTKGKSRLKNKSKIEYKSKVESILESDDEDLSSKIKNKVNKMTRRNL